MINGYIKLLHSRIPSLLPAVLQKLFSALVLLLEFDVIEDAVPAPSVARRISTPSNELVQQIEQGIFNTSIQCAILSPGFPKHSFKRFNDARIAVALREMCKLLSAHGGFPLLHDHVCELLSDPSSVRIRNQLLFILISILSGTTSLSIDVVSSVVDILLEVSSDGERDSPARRDITGALIAECLGVVCQKPATVVSILPRVLYPCLELLGEGMDIPSGKLAQAAWETLVILARLSLFEGNVKLLINANTDYLVDSLSKRMAQSCACGTFILVSLPFTTNIQHPSFCPRHIFHLQIATLQRHTSFVRYCGSQARRFCRCSKTLSTRSWKASKQADSPASRCCACSMMSSTQFTCQIVKSHSRAR